MNFLWENLFRAGNRERTLKQHLRENILFQDLSERELGLVEKLVHIRTFRPGEVIFHQGDAGVGMYIVYKGRVNISVDVLNSGQNEVVTSQIATMLEGDFFGDMALVEPNSRRSATATAVEETSLIGFFKPELNEITQRNPSAGVKILLRISEILAVRLRESTTKVADLDKGPA